MGHAVSLQTKEKMSRIAKEKNFLLNNILKHSSIRPTKPEKIMIDLIVKHNLPFKYTGDGTCWVGGLNPDFVEATGEKVAIEVFGNYWHSSKRIGIRYYSTAYGRTEIFRKKGWALLIFWESELKSRQAEFIVLSRLHYSATHGNKQLTLNEVPYNYTVRSY